MKSAPVISGIAWGLVAATAFAISPDNPPAADNSVEAERKGFQVHEEFEIDLYADETLGIANPIAIQWDARGRLWVLCTLAYAQLRPGELPDDKLFILEDTDGDGRADRSTVFANGLDMPTGFALGHGGAWVAEGPDLVFLPDSDGDDRADGRHVVLTGFGTGDTHQNISNLIFDAGGYLYFSQGLHTYSQVETPWGVSRGDTAGFWRFDPRLTRLDPFCFPNMTGQNPWGVGLDRWGALFVKSNGPHLCFATPGLIRTTHPRELMQFAQVGQTPGKSMGVEIVESAHLPDWIQNSAIISGYFAREVSAIPLVEEDSGFAVAAPVRLIYGEHASFRPVDTRQGPDGAIYVADWFNPIINHYQVSLRHPDRDYSHGRIWRLSARGRAPVGPPDLEKLSTEELFGQLKSREVWARTRARRMLEDLDGEAADTTVSKLLDWIETLGAESSGDQLGLVEAAGILESQGVILPEVLDRLAASPEPRVRALVARVIGRSAEPVPDARARLAKLLSDRHPRPRLEAVVACGSLGDVDSLKLALTALDAGTDKFIDYALGQTVFALEDKWLPELRSGALVFGKPAHLAFVLETHGGPEAVGAARRVLAGELDAADRGRLLGVLARLGTPEDLRAVFDHAHREGDAGLLTALAEAPANPKGIPDESLRELLGEADAGVRLPAIRLAGKWKAAGLDADVEALSMDESASAELRGAALRSLAQIRGKAAASTLRGVVLDAKTPMAIRRAALEALARADAAEAAGTILGTVEPGGPGAEFTALIPNFIGESGAAGALAEAFEKSGAPPDSATAQEILNALNRIGRTDAKLTPILNQAIGRRTGAPEYDAERVAAIVSAVRAGEADAAKGAEIFRRTQLACMACHRIGDEGGVIGPSLNGVGAGLPLDQIVESILWPDRQIKEGFQAMAFTTTAGASITGYIERESDEIVWYRNTAAPWILPLAKKDIAKRETIPTLMPPGLTASLSEAELRDLAAYLASLKG
ncbi:MAG: HEAT repeat domain-containing protein [Verrucomicrobiae bacterium]|nr:HEAT repeat domain-containing protein [Verrucomicrobiae bacterium]